MSRLGDSYMMDVENHMMEQFTQQPLFATPADLLAALKGPERYKHKEWAAHVKAIIQTYDGAPTWDEYVAWVKAGGGDFWTSDEALEENAEFWDKVFE